MHLHGSNGLCAADVDDSAAAAINKFCWCAAFFGLWLLTQISWRGFCWSQLFDVQADDEAWQQLQICTRRSSNSAMVRLTASSVEHEHCLEHLHVVHVCQCKGGGILNLPHWCPPVTFGLSLLLSSSVPQFEDRHLANLHLSMVCTATERLAALQGCALFSGIKCQQELPDSCDSWHCACSHDVSLQRSLS